VIREQPREQRAQIWRGREERSSQRDRFVRDAPGNSRLQLCCGNDIDWSLQDLAQLALQTDESDHTDAVSEIDEDVDIARGCVLTAGDAAEHAHIRCPPPAGGIDDRSAMPTQPSADRGIR
jgi:hypothetical protein